MNTRLIRITYFALITMLLSLSTAAEAQIRVYYVTDRQVQTVLDRIESRTNTFKSEIDRTLDNSNVDGTRSEDSINTMIANFENATDRLRNNFSSRRSTSADVEEVLNRAVGVNSFMRNNRVSSIAQSQWNLIRTDLNTLAGYYRVRSNWNSNITSPGTRGGYYVSDTQLRALLDRLQVRSSSFRQSFNSWTGNSEQYQSAETSNVLQSITEFETALQNLSRNYNNRNSGNAGVEQVLRPSAAINSYIASNQTNNIVSNRWNLVRTDLNTLAGYYRVAWDWNNTVVPGNQYSSFDTRLTGTYRLNTGQSDNVATVVERAIDHANYDANQHDRMHRNLERRLISPVTLTLEKRGQQVTMSSANGQSVTLDADGVRRTETSPNGRTVTTSVTATNRDLTINYEGDRMNEYYVSFMPMNNGQLKVTRRVYLENQNETVTAISVYDKTSQNPTWNTASYPVNTGNDPVNGFLIPNNTGIVATLDTPLSTRTARNGDRFSMTVTSPSQYAGAVIWGNVIGEPSGVIGGRANMSLTFDSIRLQNGQTYKFAGIVDQVREADGDVVSVNNEGTIRDGSQTTKTITRAGIGAVLGAIIGAIAGGGQGAAIGAGVGAGAGAGTVILQGRDNLELDTGSQFTITATAPSNVGLR